MIAGRRRTARMLHPSSLPSTGRTEKSSSSSTRTLLSTMKFNELHSSSRIGWLTTEHGPSRSLWLTAYRVTVLQPPSGPQDPRSVSYTHLRAHETRHDLVCRLLLEKKKKKIKNKSLSS